MRSIIISDDGGVAALLASILGGKGETSIVVSGHRSLAEFSVPLRGTGCEVHRYSHLAALIPGRPVRLVVAVGKGVAAHVAKLHALFPRVPVLVVLAAVPSKKERDDLAAMKGALVLDMRELVAPSIERSWKLLELRKRVDALRHAVDPAKPLWILTQNNPDPDAIASAMALTYLLGRSRRNTPVVALKGVSRNENANMVSLLGVKVKTVTAAALRRAPQIAMVDVQPRYFASSVGNVRIVIDHHPAAGCCNAPFVEVKPEYGAAAGILAEYIDAAGLRLNARLATALFYAVKTDTLLFGRERSRDDFRLFGALWPLTDHQMISQMERPRLKEQEVDAFIRALKRHSIERGCLFAPLGEVHKEDLVPRLADFVLQIGDAGFAVAWGRLKGVTTFAARALGPKLHAGEAMRAAFGDIGQAGGHRIMARATMDTAALNASLGARGERQQDALIKKRLLMIIAAQKRNGPKK